MITKINKRLEKMELMTTIISDTPEKISPSTSLIHKNKNVSVLTQDLETSNSEDSSTTYSDSEPETPKNKSLEVNKIQSWIQPTKLFYHRPTLPDMAIEERSMTRQNHFSANTIYE